MREGAMLTTGDIAALFSVDVKTANRWGRTGRIPALRTPGGHIRFRPEVIAEIIATPVKEND